MQYAAIVLGLAALGGLTMAIIRLRGARIRRSGWRSLTVLWRPPAWACSHMRTSRRVSRNWRSTALGVFVLAILGGAVLFLGFHLNRKPLPIPFVIGHGLLAVTGYVLLILAMR